jgi:hypothetical protein
MLRLDWFAGNRRDWKAVMLRRMLRRGKVPGKK